jgi:hypothetical protein
LCELGVGHHLACWVSRIRGQNYGRTTSNLYAFS